VPDKKRKKPLRGIGRPVGAACSIQPSVVWVMDFSFDQTRDGKMLKIFNVVDELTREALACDVEHFIDADGVVRCLDRLAKERSAPVSVRFDNGPKFIAHAFNDWCWCNGTGTVFTDPGSPPLSGQWHVGRVA
jgi:putative transposase